MTQLYYRARSFYQYSYIWKIFDALGGGFILSKPDHFETLRERVAPAPCHCHTGRKDLPEGVSGLILGDDAQQEKLP